MRFSLLLTVAVLLVAACSPFRRSNPNDVTVCVINNTVMGTLRVWSDVFGRTHNVPSGDRQCSRVGSGGGEVRLYAETIGGGIEGPARGVAVVPNRPGECWLWDFRGFNDKGNLVPCEFERNRDRGGDQNQEG